MKQSHPRGWLILCIYQFVANNFTCSFLNAVHLSYPFELVLCFELFGDVFGFYQLSYEIVEHLLCLGVDLGTVLVEGALSEESSEEDRIVFLQVVLMQHSPFVEADGCFFGWEFEVGYHIIVDLSVGNVCHKFHPFLLSIKVS